MRRGILLFPVMALAFLASLVALLALATGRARGDVVVPPGFTNSQVASGLTNPMDMAFAPNGQLFVAEQRGTVRVVKADGTLATFKDISGRVDSAMGERGLLGIAFDPNFSNNHFVYLYYTRKANATTPAHNRVMRVTADGDRAVAGSDTLIFRLDDQRRALHMGGAIKFGNDDKLYISTGDNKIPVSENVSQKLTNLFGKVLRINKNGTIPPNNPFYASASGKNRAIWARGLRNPFNISVKPRALFVTDVGEHAWEEINQGVSGANYGWPKYEGYATPSPSLRNYQDPLLAYPHPGIDPSAPASGCAITGGTFYNPATVQFPDYQVGDYFFTDFCSGWIRRYDVASDESHNFATGLTSVVDLEVSESGGLYYLSRGDSASGAPAQVGKISRPSP